VAGINADSMTTHFETQPATAAGVPGVHVQQHASIMQPPASCLHAGYGIELAQWLEPVALC
jgi:hypothetical protein